VLGTGSLSAATIARVRLSNVSNTSNVECEPGFSGNGYFIGTTGTLSWDVILSGTVHHLGSGTQILYLNGTTTTPVPGTPSTVSGRHKITRLN